MFINDLPSSRPNYLAGLDASSPTRERSILGRFNATGISLRVRVACLCSIPRILYVLHVAENVRIHKLPQGRRLPAAAPSARPVSSDRSGCPPALSRRTCCNHALREFKITGKRGRPTALLLQLRPRGVRRLPKPIRFLGGLARLRNLCLEAGASRGQFASKPATRSRSCNKDCCRSCMPTHTATTRLAAIEKAAKRFRAREARLGSTAMASILAVATVSGGAASERDVMMSLASCSGAARSPGGGLIEISRPC